MNRSISRNLVLALVLLNYSSVAFTQTAARSALDGTMYGVVLDDPGTKQINIKPDVLYYKDDSIALHIDVYTPPDLKTGEKRPAIVFLNAVGDVPNDPKVKSWAIYTSWPKLMAAKGYIGISMESDRQNVNRSIAELFKFLDKDGARYGVDKDKLGVYAASANVSRSINYLMSEEVSKGIKAAVLYYGAAIDGPFRKDLPVYFVIAEGDVRGNNYASLWASVLKNNAPWTIRMATGMPHAFDAFKDNDESRIVLKETISFWQNHLDPVPQPSWKPSEAREIISYLYSDAFKGLPLLKKFTENNPQDQRALFTYGEILFREKKFDEAKASFLQLLKADPQHIRAMIQMVALMHTTGNTVEAEKYIQQAINTGKMTSNLYGQLGFALLVANKNSESAKYYEKAVATEPKGVDYYNLACAYAKDNVADKALVALEKAVDMGYGTRAHMDSDGDLESIRSTEKYKQIVSKIK